MDLSETTSMVYDNPNTLFDSTDSSHESTSTEFASIISDKSNPMKNESAICTLNLKSTDIIIDFQGVKSAGCTDVIVREICFISVATGRGEVVKLKLPISPYSLSADVRREWSYYGDSWHKIPLSYGNVNYNALANYGLIIKLCHLRILTKGEQKRRFLETLFEIPVINIENFNAPNFRVLSELYSENLELCDFHSRLNNFFCAKYKAGLIYLWAKDNNNAFLK